MKVMLHLCYLLIWTSAGALWIAGCRTPSLTPGDATATADMPDQEAWDTTIYLSQDSLQQAIVHAGRRRRYVAAKQAIIDEGLHAEFFDETGKLSSTLDAQDGIIDEVSHNMVVTGQVVVTSVEHGTLETDSLRWIESERRIVTDAAVRIMTARDTITGEGFEGETSLKRWKILRNVKGLFDRESEVSERVDDADPR